MLVFRLLVPVVAGFAAVVLGACSSARFGGLDGLGYGGAPAREAARPNSAAPVSRKAPVAAVDRGNSDSIRYYGRTDAAYATPAAAAPRAALDARPATGYRQASVATAPYGAGAVTRRQAPGYGGWQNEAGALSAGAGSAVARRPAAPSYRRSGTARWMGASWTTHTTTTQEPFDPERLTGAHATLPLPSFVYVTSRATGRTVLIRVNDRPPVAHGDPDTVVIVSRRVADLLGFSQAGTTQVDLQFAGPAGIEASGQHEEAFLRQQPWFGRVADGGGSRQAWATAPANAAGQADRYAAPGYPRWDGTQR